MAGWIETRQKCFICGGPLLHDQRRRGCFCKDHPEVRADKFIVRFGDIYRRCRAYNTAEQILSHIRHEKGERKGRFNQEDYRSLRPNSYNALKDKYLARKKDRRTYKKIERYIERAAECFGERNLREINGADIEDYLYSIPGISDKTRANHMTQLRDFWKWALRRGNIITLAEMPAFPEITFELGYRKITTWEIQEQIISKVREISYQINPKIWLGIDMLATYTALRPDDLRRVYENSLDVNGWLVIYNPTKKKNKFKTIRLHDDHVSEWRECQRSYPAMPDMLFFRHHGKVRGTSRSCIVFGENMFYLWWKKACDLVGVEGVPLYPGTKHTTATETARMLGTDKARTASGLTNKAFDRYCTVENDGSFEVISAIRMKKKGEVIPIRKREEG